MKVRETAKTAKRVTLEVTLDTAEVEEHTKNAYMVLAMRYDLKPEAGKTSREVVAERLDAQQVSRYVSSMAIDQTWQLAVDKMGLLVAGIPECVYESPYQGDRQFVYLIDAVRVPVFELSNYEPVELFKENVSVSEEDIDNYIAKETRRFMVSAPDAGATNKHVNEHSFVNIAMQTTKNGTPFDPFCFESRDYELGVGDMPDGFDDHLVGLACGDSVSFDFEGPDLANARKGITMPAQFSTTVTVNGMLKRVLPTIDDAWVKEHVKDCSTVEQMRRRVREEVMASKTEENKQFSNYLAAVQVGARLEGPIPDEVFEAEYKLAASQFQQAMQRQSMTAQQYYKKHDTNAQEFSSDLLRQTKEQLRQQYALDAFARYIGISVTGQDMLEYYALIDPGKEEDVRKQVVLAGQLTQTRQIALRMKTNQWLVDHCVEPEDDGEDSPSTIACVPEGAVVA